MKLRTLNVSFLLLQGLLTLIDCIAVAYLSPILVSLGYSNLRIGWIMTLGALASALARPVWGTLNDRFSCARQVTLGSTAVGMGCYFFLTHSAAHPAVTAFAVMGLYVTVVCMMNFADAWALRLISSGAALNYGATRAGGSFSYAVGAAAFGSLAARWGFMPGNYILWGLFILLCGVVCTLPNPPPAGQQRARKAPFLYESLAALSKNRVYCVMLAAFFLCTLATCSMESFYSVLILSLGGTERHVGIALFLQAMSELPVMVGYTRLRRRLGLSPAALMGTAMFFYGLKALTLGFSASLGVVLAAALFQSVSFALFTPACVDFMLKTVSADCLSTAHLVFLAIGQGAAAVVGNTLGGVLAERFGVAWMFRLVSLLALSGSVLACRAAFIQTRRRTTV